jgi:ParB/RepB/Spo0J family partition protein
MEDRAIQNVRIEDLVRRAGMREHPDKEELVGLAQSIKELGMQVPVLAYREGTSFVLYDGDRRVDAALMAGQEYVPALVEDRELPAVEVLLRKLVIHIQREDLSPIDKAKLLRRIMTEGRLTAAQVAVKSGMSPAGVSKHLALLLLSPEVQEQIARGKLAMSTAYELAKLSDPEARDRLTREAVAGGLPRDRVAARARGNGRVVRPRKHRNRVVIPMGEGRSLAVTGPGLSVDALVTWLEELLTRIRGVSGQGVDLVDLVKLVAPANSK